METPENVIDIAAARERKAVYEQADADDGVVFEITDAIDEVFDADPYATEAQFAEVTSPIYQKRVAEFNAASEQTKFVVIDYTIAALVEAMQFVAEQPDTSSWAAETLRRGIHKASAVTGYFEANGTGYKLGYLGQGKFDLAEAE